MTAEQIQKDMLNNVSNDFDKSDGSFVYDILKSTAIEFEKRDQKNDDILDKIDVEKLTGEELTRFIYQRTPGIQRRLATYATTPVTIKGNPFAEINAGDLVAANEIFYEIIEDATLDDTGKGIVVVRCQLPGIVGNVPANQITSFPVTLPGITSVTNEDAVTTGYEEESDESLRDRYYEKLQKPGKAGNKNHYLEWARSVVGVGKVKVFPLWNGALTVKVSILDTNIGVAEQGLINNVAAYIETQRPFGAIVTVATGVELPINISAQLTLEQNITLEDVSPVLTVKIADYLKNLAYASDYVSYAQIGREILSVPGVIDYQNLLLNRDTVNVQLEAESVPVVGEIVWT